MASKMLSIKDLLNTMRKEKISSKRKSKEAAMLKPEIFGSLNLEKIPIEVEASPLLMRFMNSTISSRKNRQKNV